MPFIDTNLIQSWTTSTISSQIGINRNSNNLGNIVYIDSRVIDSQYPSGYTYIQGKNYQIVTGVSSSTSTIGAQLYIRFSAPFKDSIASVTTDVSSITQPGVVFYTYATPLSTSKSKSIVRYGANNSFTQSIITKSTLNELDFLINGYREFSYLDRSIDDSTQPSGWYFGKNLSNPVTSYNWIYNSTSIAPTYSIFGSGLDTIVTKNFIAKSIEYDTFSLELEYTSSTNTGAGMSIYIVRSDLLKNPLSWGPSIVDFTSSTIFATTSLIGTNTNGTKNYLVISASESDNYAASLDNINIVGAYHPKNNLLQLTSDGSGSYSGTTPIMVDILEATYSHILLQNGTPYTLKSRIGNGLFRSGIWENGVWNSGWRDDEEARDFDDVAFSVLTESDISWKIEIRGSTYSIANFATGSAVSIGNIVAIDINDNRKLLKDYYKIENLGIAYNYSVTGEKQSAYGWMRVNLDTTFPYRRIEKDSQNHKIKVTKNIWLSGGFFNGYFSGVWNNGLFKGFPRITEMFNTHWIDGFFNGGHFNSNYSDVYRFTGFDARQACTNGYINLTFGQYTSILPGDYILITFESNVVDGGGYAGVALVIAVEHKIDPTTGAMFDVVTIDKVFDGRPITVPAGNTSLGSVIRYTATGLIQNFKFYDNNRSKIKSIDNPLSTAVFSFNSWIDVNYDSTRAVTLGRDFRMYEPLTKKSINRNNLYGYPTYDVLASLSRFRDSNTLDYKLYKLGTKYKVFTDLIGDGSGFNEPFSDLDFSNFTNAGWTASYNNINDFSLKRTENIISLNNTTSTDFLNSGVTGDELYVTASNTGLILNNSNINISKSRYSIVEFDVITYSVTSTNFTYKNPNIYSINDVNSNGLPFIETISTGPSASLNNTIVSSYQIGISPPGPSIQVDDILVMIDLYGDISTTTINLVAPNNKIINIKRNGTGFGTELSNTKFSLRDVYTKISSGTTPHTDTYLMDKGLGQGDSPYVSDVTTLSDLISGSIYGIWRLYIKYNPLATVPCDLANWSISIQYKDLVSVDTEPISTLPILNLSNLNYDITTQLSGYDNVQVYKKMNYLPIRENVNHLKVKNTFRLDSIEEATPAKWGGYGKNQPTKKYEYFYNKTDMMLSINGNATNGADTSMLVLDNINMYEVDMIPFFKYFDEDNIYKGIQIPYIGEAPDIDYLNSDFVFIDNITVGVDAIDANGNNSLATDCQTAVIITTPTITPTFVVITNQSPDSAMPDPKSFVINQNNNSDIQLNAYIVASNISDEPTEVEWTTIFSSGTSITIIAGNTLTPTVSGLASGNYRLRVRAVSATSSVLLSPITDTAIIIINISTTVTTVTTVPTVTTQPITLTRFGGPDSKVQELLQNTVTSIVYDSVNGYTFNLILNTISGYRFVNTAASIVSGSWFDNTVYTINSSTFTSGDTQLTLNIKITGVAPSITNLSYVVTVNTGTYAPKITNNPNGYTISGPGGTGNLNYTSKDITLENNTGVDIWLWVGVNQFTTGSNGAAVDTLYYNGFTIYFPFSVIELDDVPTTNGQYFSTIPYQVPTGSSIAGSLFRGYTSDTAHTVQLWYSYSITGTKYMLGT
jgi:hypothetical protein